MRVALVLAVVLLSAPTLTGELRVDPEVGNSNFTAVFDAKLGERIVAMSSAVDCKVTYDEKAGTFSGNCAVPLQSIKVDNNDTKTDHFQQWTTNKKSAAKDCKLEATFSGVKVGKLQKEKPATFSADVPFTVCGRPGADGAKERVTGTALLLPAGNYGEKTVIRVRARIAKFSRDRYQIGPQHTEGWLSRVQSLASVVAEEGSIELSLFATETAPKP